MCKVQYECAFCTYCIDFYFFIKFAALKNVNPYGNNFDIKYLQYL